MLRDCRVVWMLALLAGCSTTGETSPETDTDAATSGGIPTSTGGVDSGSSSTDAADDTSSVGGSEGPTGDPTGTSTGEPPAAICDGHPEATDELGVTAASIEGFSTFEHVAVQWLLEGDTNGNAEVFVRLRPEGGAWREGTPLQRVPAGSNNDGYTWANAATGSQFGLEPGTNYELELQLIDDDGGCVIETLEVATRLPLDVSAPSRTVSVDPSSLAEALASAQPGDAIELQAGSYAGFEVSVDGTAEAPIVIRSTAGATVDGEIRLDGRAFVVIEGLRVLDQIKFNGAHDLAIRGCTIETERDGIAMLSRGENIHVADNDVTGPTLWNEAALGVDGDNLGEGIVLTGPGHVIEHNRVRGFRDCISLLEDEAAEDQYNVDILRNDLDACADDGVEADFCEHDCRILENRVTNTFIALSSQPSLGGPTYFARNSVFNVILSAFKLQRSSVGDVLWHNTVIKNGDAFGVYTDDVFSHLHTRNNVFIGGPGESFGGYSSGSGRVLALAAVDSATLDMDYDGFGSTVGTVEGRVGDITFASLAELMGTTTAEHAVEVTLAAFASPPAYPSNPFPELPAPELSLFAEAPAVDAGSVIPGFNDTHGGAAPDLGAHELGEPLPQWGPRD